MKKIMRRLGGAAAALGVLWALAHAQAARFQYHGLINRVITPNNDGRNDVAIVCFDNFADASIVGTLYSPLGSEVGKMTLQDPASAGCTTAFPGDSKPQSLTWDGRAGGAVVSSGIYIYKIRTELQLFTGALLVVR